MTKRKLALFVAMSGILASCVGRSPEAADEMIRVGSHRLEMHREGRGRPVVVIDAGLADGMDKLRPLSDRIARVTQVVTYNRAGYGRSEAGPLPRDAVREADELKAMLDAASVPAPYVLVGHSLGALNVQVFAARHPEAVAGIVLLDPPPLSFILGLEYRDLGAMAERMTAEWQAVADSAALSPRPEEAARAAFFGAIASEHREMFLGSARAAAAISTFGTKPLVVMAAGRPNPAFGPIADEYQMYWIDQSRTLAAKSTQGRFVLADSSSHYLYVDAPDLVEKSILSLVLEARVPRGTR